MPHLLPPPADYVTGTKSKSHLPDLFTPKVLKRIIPQVPFSMNSGHLDLNIYTSFARK